MHNHASESHDNPRPSHRALSMGVHEMASILTSEDEQHNLQAFALAARFLSFKDAAAHLQITPGAVSKRIVSLENRLGFALFYRLTRSIRLTREGEAIIRAYHHAHTAFCREMLLNLDSNAASVTLYAHPSITHCWLIDRLEDFYQRYPEVHLNILTGNHPIDFDEHPHVDLALYYADHAPQGMESQCIMSELSFPVCASLYQKHLSLGSQPSSLTDVCCIHDSAAWHFSSEDLEWQRWAHLNSFDLTRFGRKLTFDTSMASARAAMRGIGVAMGRFQLIEPYIQSEQLVLAFPELRPLYTQHAYWVAWPRGQMIQPAVLACIDWLSAQGAKQNQRLIQFEHI